MKARWMTPEAAAEAQSRAAAAWKQRGVDTGPAGRMEARQKPVFAPKRSKHGAVKVYLPGGKEKFDSKLEYRVWLDLQFREKAGEIRDLRRQVRFSLFAPGGEHLGTYCADFVFEEHVGPYWPTVVADAKSAHTRRLPGWERIKRLMVACHRIVVRELP